MASGESMTKFERRQCQDKQKHSRQAAEHIAAKMTKRKGVEFNAYLCEICGAWHVGHKKTSFRMFMLKNYPKKTED